MYKRRIAIMMLATIFMLASVSFAKDDKDVTLGDAIKILRTLSGCKTLPALNVTGTWAVKSFQNDEERTGEAYLEMMPDGKVSGYAELTSLPGLSTITGIVYDYTFDLNLTSDSGSMTVHGTVSSDNQDISGTFTLDDINVVSWEGQRLAEVIYTGTYVHNVEENKIVLDVDGNDIVTTYRITEFTETHLTTNVYVWERDTPGEVGNLVGTWKNTIGNTKQTMILSEDGTFKLTILTLP